MKLRAVIPLFISIFIFLVTLYFYIRQDISLRDDQIYNVNGYKININIPEKSSNILDNEIDNYVKNQTNEFFSQIDISIDKNVNFDITYEVSSKDNIKKVALISKKTIESQYKYDLKTIYYDQLNDKLITLIDYFDRYENFEILSDICYHAIKYELKMKSINVDDEIIKNASSTNLENYDSFEFIESGLKIDFILKQPKDIQISVTLPYSQINYLLKSEYRHELTHPYKRDISQFVGKKLIAFTFDDGPNSTTTKILLDGLNKYNAKVTFFVLGNKANANSQILKRAYIEGNQIGSHTYNHKNLIRLSANQIKGEINNTNSVIREIIGVEPSVFRPPYGNINPTVKKYVNVPIIMWNIDPLDWTYKDKEIVKNNIISEAEDGDIILVHDIYLSSVEGALLAMEELYKQGFAFVTIEEMMLLKQTEWQPSKNYYKF